MRAQNPDGDEIATLPSHAYTRRRSPCNCSHMDKPVTLEAKVAVDKKAEKEAKKAERAAKKAGKDANPNAKKATGADAVDISDVDGGASAPLDIVKELSEDAAGLKITKEQQRVASNRATTGVLASTAIARDIKFASFSVSLGGRSLVTDCDLELTQGCRYGLLGDNGSGKSSVLAAIAQREVPVPKHISMFHLHEEAPPSEMSGVEAVINHVVEETARLEAMVEQIMEVSTARRTSGSSDSLGLLLRLQLIAAESH